MGKITKYHYPNIIILILLILSFVCMVILKHNLSYTEDENAALSSRIDSLTKNQKLYLDNINLLEKQLIDCKLKTFKETTLSSYWYVQASWDGLSYYSFDIIKLKSNCFLLSEAIKIIRQENKISSDKTVTIHFFTPVTEYAYWDFKKLETN